MNDMNENIIVEEEPEITEESVELEESGEDTVEEAIDELPVEDVQTLKAELDELKFQLEQSRTMYDKLHAECMEFSSLYPDVPLSSIPDKIWESAKAGRDGNKGRRVVERSGKKKK